VRQLFSGLDCLEHKKVLDCEESKDGRDEIMVGLNTQMHILQPKGRRRVT